MSDFLTRPRPLRATAVRGQEEEGKKGKNKDNHQRSPRLSSAPPHCAIPLAEEAFFEQGRGAPSTAGSPSSTLPRSPSFPGPAVCVTGLRRIIIGDFLLGIAV